MKILLIQPPIEDFYDTEIRHFPLGLAYLKAAIRKAYPDYEVKIIDFRHAGGRRTISIPTELKYLKEYYSWVDGSPFCLFHNYYHFGANYENIGRLVIDEAPDLVGISSLFSAYHREVLKTAEVIKKHINVPIVVGGAHATAMPELMLDNYNIDYVVVGEGERPMVNLIGLLEGEVKDIRGVDGLAYRSQGMVVINNSRNYEDNIDQISLPDCSDWDVNKYKLKERPLCFIITSRGCPYHCSFCSVRSVFCRRYSRRSNENIISELEKRYQEGYRCFDFEDDNLAFEAKEFSYLLRIIANRFPDVELTAMNGINYTHLDLSLLSLMSQAGFRQINLSIVSEKGAECEELSRFCSFSKFDSVAQDAKSLGLSVVAYLILGLPKQSLESALESLLSLAKLPVTIGASPFYLAPGSELFSINKRPSGEAAFLARLSALNHEHSLMSREELYSLFILARIINFVKSLPQEVMALNNRQRDGVLLLQQLARERILYAATPKGLMELTKFRYEVYEKAVPVIKGLSGVFSDLIFP